MTCLYVKSTRLFTLPLRELYARALHQLYVRFTLAQKHTPTLQQLYITFTPTLRQLYVNSTCPLVSYASFTWLGTVKLEEIDRGGVGFEPASIALLE